VKRIAVVVVALLVIGAAVGLALVRLGRSAPSGSGGLASTTIVLTCPDSAGQQGRNGETVVGGVEGLVLPGSGNPASLTAWRGTNGRRYYFYKVFLAVSKSSSPFATVSIVRPTSARMVYGPAIAASSTGPARVTSLVAASRSQIRMPVCGPRFTGFAGAIVVLKPSNVTFSVSSPGRKTQRVTVPLGNT